MSKRVLVGAAALVLVSGYAVHLQFENSRLREALAAAPAPGKVPEPIRVDGVQEAGGPEVAVAGSLAEGVADAAAELEAADAGPERRERWQDGRRDRMQRMTAAFDDPELRIDMIERQMGRIDASYAGFFRGLNLDAEQVDLLKTLMAEQGVVGWESRMRRFAADSDEARAQVEASERQQRQVIEGQIAALLGQDGADRLQDYTESLPHREEVAALATRLSYTESPLSPGQSELLVQGLQSVASEFRYTNDLSEMGRGRGRLAASEVALYFEEREQRDALVFAAAAAALNEEQLAAFADRQIADRDRERRRIEFVLENGGGIERGRPPQGGGRP